MTVPTKTYSAPVLEVLSVRQTRDIDVSVGIGLGLGS